MTWPEGLRTKPVQWGDGGGQSPGIATNPCGIGMRVNTPRIMRTIPAGITVTRRRGFNIWV